MDNGASSYHRFLQGDSNALEELVSTYSDAIVRYAYFYVRNSSVAEDVMEDTFATLIVKRKKFDGDAPFLSYLFRIARNKSLDHLRSKHSKTIAVEDLENVLKSENTENEILNRERYRELYSCMQKLPKQYSEILYLIYFQDFSIYEVGKTTGKNRKQIYNLLSRAKSALKEIFIKEGIGYEDL